MKKIKIILTLIILVSILLLTCFTIFINISHVTYKKETDYLSISKAYGSYIEYTIKDEHNGSPVMCLEKKAFYDYDTLEIINFGLNLKVSKALSFGDCDNLRVVNFNTNFREPGNNMFFNDKNLEEVNIPMNGKLRFISGSMFYNCISLKSIILPDNLYSIGSLSFYNCTLLEEISIHSSLYSIETNSFKNCTNLKRIYIRGNSTNFYRWINYLPLEIEIIRI